MTEVVFWLPAVNPYWRDRFNALAADGEVDFECWFNRHLDPQRSWEVDPSSLHFRHSFLAGDSKRAFLRDARRSYRSARPRIIFTFHHEPKLWLVWLHRLRGGHVALYALMTWDSWVTRSKAKEIAKRIFFTSASSTLTPGPQSDEYIRKYGARRISRLHHAVDADGLRSASDDRKGSRELRLLYIGRMIEGKGLRMLMRALEPMLARHKDTRVRFVGDGPLQGEVRSWAASIGDQVEVSDFVQADRISEVYRDSDVMLFPTEGDPYGLVVDEALAAGVPVVASDRAGDISWRLEDGRGWILPFDDVGAWTRTLDELAADRSLLPEMSAAALRYSAGHDLGRWVAELKSWLHTTG
ncbi:glycosyltransferase family 4 protein [Curtobacterium oceanosedimentum]|uniref:glycosyltransferase family 4 protein n=1 Tax=Curtobacterium oceanosedimentum TaxID=465820 RepID=UPI00339B841C